MKNHLYHLFSLLFVISIQIQAQEFTDTQGQLNISNSGTASYTLPIALPPSIQNVGPVINLTYNSGQLGGIAGQGWNISGVSSIHRIATRKDIDGFIDGVDFDDNDKLALDGQRLILKTGNYWEQGSTYETEVQSNTKIELLKSGDLIYFIVTTADGSKMWYGKSFWGNNGIDATAYYIVRQEDINGNYILYDYTQSAGNALYISEIKFSGNKYVGTSLLNKVKFNYESAQRAEIAYVNGIKISKDLILKKVEVLTNSDQLFRRYELTHTADSQLGYQYVKQVQEFNGALEGANPVVFEYNTTAENARSLGEKSYTTSLELSGAKFFGDFDGDGKMDFITNNKMYTNLLKTNTVISLPAPMNFTATTTTNNKLNQFESLVRYESVDSYKSRVLVYNLINENVTLAYIKEFPLKKIKDYTITGTDTGLTAVHQCASALKNKLGNSNVSKSNALLFSGDYNGDGITEVLIEAEDDQPAEYNIEFFNYNYVPDNPCNSSTFVNDNIDYCCPITRVDGKKEHYILDLNPDFSSDLGTNGYMKINDPNGLLSSRYKYNGDFDGDGKMDILCVDQVKTYRIVEIVRVGNTAEAKLIGSGYLSDFDSNKHLLLGDYNGDGKTDLMIPVGYLNYDWAVYFSNPKTDKSEAFEKEIQKTLLEYAPNGNGRENGEVINYYYAVDTNGDSKTDLVNIYSRTYPDPKFPFDPNSSSETYIVSIISSTDSNGIFKMKYDYMSYRESSGWPEKLEPIIAPFNYLDKKRDFVLYRPYRNELYYYSFSKNIIFNSQLKKVSSSFGKIIDEITYMPLEPYNTTGNGSMNNAVYSSIDALSYPYVEIKRIPQSYVVTQHKNTAVGFTKYMDFRYHGLVANLEGMGAVGYKKTARSAWYTNAADPKIWSIIETDPLQRGAITRQYTQLFNSGQLFSFTYGNLSNLVSLTQNTYQSSISPSKVYSLLLTRQNTRDYLTNYVTDVTNTYEPEYNLLTQSVMLKFTGTTFQGNTTTINQYENNPTGVGANYYIGRLKQTNTTKSAYSDTKKSETKYTYTNNRVTKTESKANNTDNVYLTQDYTYDTFGNVLTQTTSVPNAQPAVAARTVSYTYDTTGRYLKTSTDVQGLITTNDTYHPLYGMVTQSTNPFGLINKSTYDNWGKVTKETDYLGKNTNYNYTRSTDKIILYKNHDTGIKTITVRNLLGWVTNEQTRDIDGATYNKVDYVYDYLGRKTDQSEPYITTASQWSKTTYDVYGRVKDVTSFTGKVTNYSYSQTTTGFKVGVNDGIKVTSSVTNANGHTLTSTDPGGAITYTYFADGNLKTSSFSGNTQSITYDDWGRKKQLVDPSAGTYSYTYNAYGETIEESTPNGVTVYTLDDFGNVTKKQNIGNNTSLTSTYTYDNVTKLLTQIDVIDVGVNPSTYTYEYDTYKRPKYITERTPYGQFNKYFTYDGYGRVYTESYSSRNLRNNKYHASKIRNMYKNGYHWQIVDDATSKVLWSNDTYNERGQLTQGTYGNGIKHQQAFDPFGYYAGINFTKEGQATPLLWLGYQFNPITANPILRTNSGFNTQELFKFEDNFDRLTEIYTTQNGVTTTQTQAYDNTGRITDNSQIGSYLYGNSAKKYQVTGITLNTQGGGYANPSLDLTVSYNSFKAPHRINQRNKETLFFTYNTFEQRSSMFYGDTQEVKDQKAMRKHYSYDGVQEITDNIATDQTSFVIYIGGDAYSAPIILKGDGVTKEYLYLHRDYQGSIMAISNEVGNFVEQRLYDAWGLLKGVKDGQGNNLSKLTVLDRGYTGHEHLQGIGLIHMNARLYDPVVHRFMGPDNFVQDPSNTQNYNRYGYVLNNPLKYTDPSGEIGVFIAMAIGAAVSVGTYVVSSLVNDRPVTLTGVLSSAILGAVSGTITFGIGEATSTIANFALKSSVQALAHGGFQGVMSGMQGGNFSQGFYSGALSSLAASAFGADLNGKNKEGLGWGHNFRSSDTGMIMFGTVSGGVGASLTGGNFWQGAATGFIVSALNHAMPHGNKTKKQRLAEKLAKRYQKNENRIIAESIVAEALLETTEPGEILTMFREDFDKIYGDTRSHEANEVYSNGIEVIKNLKDSFGGGKVTDYMLFKTSLALYSDVIYLQSENSMLSTSIKYLDKSTYYNYIAPHEAPRGGFKGGGASGNF